MPIIFLNQDEARASETPAMTVVTSVPSPWGEAAKAILAIKNIEYVAVPFDATDEAQRNWTGTDNAPCLMIAGDPPRNNWLDILLYAEHVKPSPSLIPADAGDRALMMGLSHELMGRYGLGWVRRVQLIHQGIKGNSGFPAPAAHYLSTKYGGEEMSKNTAVARATALLALFDDRLENQSTDGSKYLFGNRLTAADIYLAAMMGLFAPLTKDQCDMNPKFREAFTTPIEGLDTSFFTRLLAHRDYIYQTYIGLPVQLKPA